MHGFHRQRAACALTALALAAATGTAQGSGFQIREQSATALGSSMAGATAGSEDITTAAFNPAVIGLGQENQIGVFGSYIAPRSDIENGEAEAVTRTGNRPYSGDRSEDGSDDAFVPSLATRWNLNDQFALGLVISAPFGLKTEYDRDFIGRFYAIESELITTNINPILAFRPSERLTLAAGFQAQYADATLSNAIDFGTVGGGLAQEKPAIGQAFQSAGVSPSPGSGQEGFAEVTGDDWAFGFNLGVLYQITDATRVGIAYQSEIEHELEGSVDYESDAAGVRDVLTNENLFTETGGEADLDTPAFLSAGIRHDLTDRWALLGEVSWTDWSSFEELRVSFEDATPDSVKEEDWEDTFMVAAGAEYALSGRWTLRAGVGFDESPAPSDTRSPRIPDSDRTWGSVGATFAPTERLSISGAYTRVELDDTDINLNASTPGNETRGNLDADVEGSVNIVSLQANWRF